jgi:hypothetical protein
MGDGGGQVEKCAPIAATFSNVLRLTVPSQRLLVHAPSSSSTKALCQRGQGHREGYFQVVSDTYIECHRPGANQGVPVRTMDGGKLTILT